jgi:hypothetical protein
MFQGYSAAARLADAVGYTIQRPISRALFAAEAAAELARLGPGVFENLEEEAAGLAERAENERATPRGSIELWGSLLQGLV